MPILGKETERQLTPDEIALREIEGYLDKVEHQTETQRPQGIPVQSPQSIAVNPSIASTTSSPGQTTEATPPKIILPLNQPDVEGGMKKGVVEGLRWLSEWCVMMIKKYPGRVFYLPPQINK